MTIQTIDELLDFIETNYEKLSNEKYIELLKLTLQVYVFGKPKTKEEALEEIFNHYKFIETFSTVNDNFNDVLIFALYGIIFLIFTDYIYKLGKKSY